MQPSQQGNYEEQLLYDKHTSIIYINFRIEKVTIIELRQIWLSRLITCCSYIYRALHRNIVYEESIFTYPYKELYYGTLSPPLSSHESTITPHPESVSPIHRVSNYFSKIHFRVILPSILWSSYGFFPSALIPKCWMCLIHAY